MNNTKNKERLLRIAMIAILAAMSAVIMFLSFPIPLMPSFLKIDFSDFPALIASFVMGPLAGVCVCLVKCVICLLKTSTGGIGEMINFFMGVSLVVPAGLMYKRNKTRKTAYLALLTGLVCITAFSLPLNMFLNYPLLGKFFGMSVSEINDFYYIGDNPLWVNLLIYNAPFTFIKNLFVTAITAVVYKKVSPILKKIISF